jgi:uncharacterized protein (TIGR02145 family)
MKTLPLILFIGFLGLITSFKKENKKSNNLTEIKIGTQVWSSSNLDVSTFRNGDLIQEVKSTQEWKKASEERTPAWCYYDIDPENGKKYGKLYNWYAVNDPRKLAPAGWHIPNEAEWDLLDSYLGGKKTTLSKLKSTEGWKDASGKSVNGTNESGFNALPSGYRMYYGDFVEIGTAALWWSKTEIALDNAWCRKVSEINNKLYKTGFYKHTMASVRCVKD